MQRLMESIGGALFTRMRGKHTRDPHVITGRREVEVPGFGSVVVACTVNCLGDGCPRPQLLTLKALREVADGEIVELISDNLAAVETIPAMMLTEEGTHLKTVRDGLRWKVYVRKGLGTAWD